MSVCLSARNNSAPTRRILMKLNIWVFCEIFVKFYIWALFDTLSRKLTFHYNPTRITGTLHEDVFTFMAICRWILLRMINVYVKVVEKIKTHILCSVTFSWKSCRLWDNVEKCGGAREASDDNIAARCTLGNYGHMRVNTPPHPCTLPPFHAHTQKYVIFFAFPLQQ